MRALLYDVHGNLPALEAVLADAQEAGATSYVLGGDYAMAGAWPLATVQRLRELDAVWIRGNTERWLGGEADDAPDVVEPLLAFAVEELGDDIVGELYRLPGETVLEGVHFCHASPGSDMQGLMPEAADTEAELLAGTSERRVVFGHTHLQFQREGPDGVELTNPGSVGAPFDGDTRAAYALWHDDGRIELRRAEYDHAASAAAIRERMGDAGEILARRVEQARIDPDA